VAGDLDNISRSALDEVEKNKVITADLARVTDDMREVLDGNRAIRASAAEMLRQVTEVQTGITQIAAAATQADQAATQAASAAKQQSQGPRNWPWRSRKSPRWPTSCNPTPDSQGTPRPGRRHMLHTRIEAEGAAELAPARGVRTTRRPGAAPAVHHLHRGRGDFCRLARRSEGNHPHARGGARAAGAPSLEGLTNLRGTVLPVVNTRSLFGGAPVPADDATRVVILDRGQSIGIVVDRVVSVVSVDPERIEDAASVETSVRSDLLRGVIKDQGGLGLVMVLDAARLVEQEFQALAHGRAEGTGLAAGLASDPAAGTGGGAEAGQADLEELQLVSFEVAGQEYALPIHSVREIVQLPETVTRVPKAPGSVMGVIALRDRLLPVVSLRHLFGLAAGQVADHNRVRWFRLARRGCWWAWCWTRSTKCCACGAVASMPCHRCSRPTVRWRKSPRSAAWTGQAARLDPVGRGDVRPRTIEQALKDVSAQAQDAGHEDHAVAGEDAMAANDRRAQVRTAGEEQFVVFRLMDEEFGVDIATVQEIVRVPEDLARVPRTDDHIAA
jgi:chemotaxis signal transduction protein